MRIKEVIVEREQINEAVPAAAAAALAWGAASGVGSYYFLKDKHGTDLSKWPKSAQAELLSDIVLGGVGGPVGGWVTRQGLKLAGKLGVGKSVINLVKAGVGKGKNADKVKKTLDRVEPTVGKLDKVNVTRKGEPTIGKNFMKDVEKVYAKKGLKPDGKKLEPPKPKPGDINYKSGGPGTKLGAFVNPDKVASTAAKTAAKPPKPKGVIRRGAEKFGSQAVGATVTPAVGFAAGAPEAIRDYDRGEAEVDDKGQYTGRLTGPNIGGAFGTATSHVDKDENLDFYDKTGMLMRNTPEGPRVINPAIKKKWGDLGINPRTGKPFDSPENRLRQQAYQQQQRKDQLGK